MGRFGYLLPRAPGLGFFSTAMSIGNNQAQSQALIDAQERDQAAAASAALTVATVAKLQKRLNDIAAKAPSLRKITVDGRMGLGTVSAAVAFARYYNANPKLGGVASTVASADSVLRYADDYIAKIGKAINAIDIARAQSNAAAAAKSGGVVTKTVSAESFSAPLLAMRGGSSIPWVPIGIGAAALLFFALRR